MRSGLTRVMGIAVSLLAGCGSVSGDKPDAPVVIDSPAIDSVPIDSPASFMDVTHLATVSMAAINDDDVTVTADERELFFSSDRTGTMGGNDIWVSTRGTTTEAWGAPTNVALLNSTSTDQHAHVSADGLTMYLASNRPGGHGGQDIYISARATRSAPWSTPSLITELDSNSNEHSAAPDPTGLILILDSDRSGASMRDLYVATRATTSATWGIPALITSVSTAENEQDGVLANAGKSLYFTRGGDIYCATRATTADPFGAPVIVEGINHATAGDLDPWVSEDEKVIYFASKRLAGDDDLYRATRP